MRKTGLMLAVLLLVVLQSACAPEVGSDEWCQQMVDKPKGDWTANEASEFARSCIFKSYDEKKD
jgi:hypothetical protein